MGIKDESLPENWTSDEDETRPYNPVTPAPFISTSPAFTPNSWRPSPLIIESCNKVDRLVIIVYSGLDIHY